MPFRHRLPAVAAVVGALALIPAASASAATPPSPVQGAFQAGATAAQGGFAAGAAAAQSGWNAGATALQGSIGTGFGLGLPGLVNMGPTGPMGPLGAHGPLGANGQVPTGLDAWNLGPSGPLGPGGQLGHIGG